MSWTHKYRQTLPAEPARVFRALTDSAELSRWFAEHAEIAPGAGGKLPGGHLRFWGRYTYGAPSRDSTGATWPVSQLSEGPVEPVGPVWFQSRGFSPGSHPFPPLSITRNCPVVFT